MFKEIARAYERNSDDECRAVLARLCPSYRCHRCSLRWVLRSQLPALPVELHGLTDQVVLFEPSACLDAHVATRGHSAFMAIAWWHIQAGEAVEVMREQGFDISAHRSRNVRDLDLEPFDVIVALTPSIAARLPPVDRPERVVVWDIDDPYGGDLAVYRRCAAAIESKLRTLPIAGNKRLSGLQLQQR